MPLEQRVIQPIYVSRGCFPPATNNGSNGGSGVGTSTSSLNNIPNELEFVTNGTLSHIIYQLSTLSYYADDLFGSLGADMAAIVQKTGNIQKRLDKLIGEAEQLDSASDSGPYGNGQHGKKEFHSKADHFDQQVVARNTIPIALKGVYDQCDKPPSLDKLNPFRDDDIKGLTLYTNPNYFFELWRKEMLSEKSKKQGVKAKYGDNVHSSNATPSSTGGKSRRKQKVSTDQANVAGGYAPGTVSSPAPPPPPGHNHPMMINGQPVVAQLSKMSLHQQQQQQYQIYSQGQPQPGGNPPAHYQMQPNAQQYQQRPEQGSYNVIDGSYIDPNNYQHHFVQHQYNNGGPGHNHQTVPGQTQLADKQRPNSLELSHQQDVYGQLGPQQRQEYYAQQQQYQAAQRQNIYGAQQQQQQQQPGSYPSPNSANLTPTRRASANNGSSGNLSRPSAPPPAPPPGGSGGSSASNSMPGTPSRKQSYGSAGMAGSPAGSNLNRDQLPPPPPPPPPPAQASQQQQQSLPPPPPPMPNFVSPSSMPNGNITNANLPPPPPPPPNMSMMSNGSSANKIQNNSQPPPPPPPQTSNSSKPTAQELLSVKLKKTTPLPAAERKPLDPRSNLLEAIRSGNIKLKPVKDSKAKTDGDKSGVPLHDVASILARRVAMELSDSEEEANEDDDDDWDNDS